MAMNFPVMAVTVVTLGFVDPIDGQCHNRFVDNRLEGSGPAKTTHSPGDGIG